jgi:hypothetical protein
MQKHTKQRTWAKNKRRKYYLAANGEKYFGKAAAILEKA